MPVNIVKSSGTFTLQEYVNLNDNSFYYKDDLYRWKSYHRR